MEHQNVMDSDYCIKCGTAILYPNKPCPKCLSINESEKDKDKNKHYQNISNYSQIDLVCTKEKFYFGISITISILIYLILFLSIIGIPYLIGLVISCLVMQGMFIGYIRGNSIKINDMQFPEVFEIAQKASLQLGLKRVPDIYVMQAGGMLNALATKFLGRNFVVIYSDILELAYQKGQDALEFIICHELAHIKRNHIGKHWILIPAKYIPFLGTAYSRACEYTCDRFAAYLSSYEGATEGLLVLAAGKKLFSNVNAQDFINQAKNDSGFWSWFSEIFYTHPHLYKRLDKVMLFLKTLKG